MFPKYMYMQLCIVVKDYFSVVKFEEMFSGRLED